MDFDVIDCLSEKDLSELYNDIIQDGEILSDPHVCNRGRNVNNGQYCQCYFMYASSCPHVCAGGSGCIIYSCRVVEGWGPTLCTQYNC